MPLGAIKVAALFVETGGCYFNLPGVDPWDIERDARNYNGPHPVVAHPPCQRWGRLGAANYARWGGEHNRPGNDGGCFASALQSLKKYGGVLEHPKASMAWNEFQLTRPNPFRWNHCPREGGAAGSAWVCEVWQSAYGHKANKATWLYYIGASKPADLDWSRPRGTHQVGFQDQRGKAANKPTLSKRDANATPIRFRDVLLSLASNSTLDRPERPNTGNADQAGWGKP
jgi:hypothetical protein